jgi:hypothetical protein
VPGNHDVDRVEIGKPQIEHFYQFNTQDDISNILLHTDMLPILLKKFSNFNDFANLVTGKTLFDSTNYFYVRDLGLQKEGKKFSINLLGLNSALFAGYDGDDKQKIFRVFIFVFL